MLNKELYKKKIIELRKKLDKWEKEYYINDAPSISDLQYDAALNKLIELEKTYPEFSNKKSITKRVGGFVDNRFKKETHKFPMFSLSNAFNKEDLRRFDKQIKDQLGSNKDIEYIMEYKIDGLSISITYNNGKMVHALTRGDGSIGEDVTHNVLTIKDIPSEINFKEKLEVRGEIYMANKMFNYLNKNGNSFANPRNAAAGTLRQLDSKIAKERKLNAFIYSIPNSIEMGFVKHHHAIMFIKSQNIKINDEFIRVKNIDKVISSIDKIINLRNKLEYEIDGIVIKVNDISKWSDIGFTAKFPKFMIAYKFPEEHGSTELLDIFPTIGRTGRVTYNAKLEPIRLAGSTVQAATLHNADYIKGLNIAIGDIVSIKKAGDIIPKVMGVSEKKTSLIWKEEKNCPACGFELIRKPDEVDQYCTNDECPQKNIAKLEHFVSRGAMDIEGLSIATLKTFIENGLITDIPSIFKLENKALEILNLPGFKEKSIQNLVNAINKSKTNNIDKFIFGLGIRHVGAKNSKTLAKRFGTLNGLINATEEQILAIRDLGDKVALSIVSFFSIEENKNMVQKLINLGMKLKELEVAKSNIFQSKTFVITGTLSEERIVFADIIELNGGNVSGSITAKTSYLLAGNNPGSKLEKAKKIGTTIINEEELYKILKGA